MYVKLHSYYRKKVDVFLISEIIITAREFDRIETTTSFNNELARLCKIER